MEKFTRLFCRLDETNRTGEKVLALEEYFTSAEPADAAWALFFLSGRKIKRAVPTRHLSEWAAKESATPIWLLSECYEAVGDLAETVALLLPEHQTRTERPLHALVEEKLLPLPEMSEEARRLTIVGLWREMSSAQRLVWNKLITGSFRVGVAKTLVVRALAGVAGVSQAEMTHRVLRFGEPNAEEYRRLFEEQPRAGAIHPYPFFLAHPLETLPEELGSPGDWIAEWKWDGIRGQLVKRRGEIAVWSRGEELVTDTFPEMRLAGSFLPDGT
ncbi:MAG: ATP-dependent DNA ligase, partial [Verrucomicrobiae bacterium]|nr:ATP-dependent DNA ligase [Verrucomicrobiae bacterium]